MREELKAINKFIGNRIKEQRNRMGVTQEFIAHKLNLTFQQVQKYEKGTNRVSAATLWKIATILELPISEFFEMGVLTPLNRPSVMYRPKLIPSGSMWCALYGENLYNGVLGLGRTPLEAMESFDRAFTEAYGKGDGE